MPLQNRARVLAILTLGSLIAGLGWDYLQQHERARDLASAILEEQFALDRCVLGESGASATQWEASLRERLALLPPGEAALAACVPTAARLEAALKSLSTTRYRRSGERAVSYLASIRALQSFPLDAPNLDLHRRLLDLAPRFAALHRSACELAHAEGAAGICQDASPPREALPFRVLLDESSRGPVSWSATTGAADISIRVAAAGRAWELYSASGDESFSVSELPPEGEQGPPLSPDLIASEPPRTLLRKIHGNSGQESLLIDVSGKTPRALEQLPAPPPGLTLAPHGSPAARVGSAWVRVFRGQEGQAQLLYGKSIQPRKDTPAGELLGAFQEGTPRLLLQRRAGSGFVDLVLVPIPGEKEPWAKEVTTTVAYVKELSKGEGEERSCGLPGERYASLVRVGGEEAVLIAVSQRVAHAYRFHATAGASYQLLCGSCPPMALETRPDGLGLYVPVRRALTPARIDAPLGFERGRSDRTAVGSCTPSRMAVIYEVSGKILLQEREPGGWHFGAAQVIAETTDQGEPVEPRLLGVGENLIALWRRKTSGRVRIEGTLVGAQRAGVR